MWVTGKNFFLKIHGLSYVTQSIHAGQLLFSFR